MQAYNNVEVTWLENHKRTLSELAEGTTTLGRCTSSVRFIRELGCGTDVRIEVEDEKLTSHDATSEDEKSGCCSIGVGVIGDRRPQPAPTLSVIEENSITGLQYHNASPWWGTFDGQRWVLDFWEICRALEVYASKDETLIWQPTNPLPIVNDPGKASETYRHEVANSAGVDYEEMPYDPNDYYATKSRILAWAEDVRSQCQEIATQNAGSWAIGWHPFDEVALSKGTTSLQSAPVKYIMYETSPREPEGFPAPIPSDLLNSPTFPVGEIPISIRAGNSDERKRQSSNRL